MNARGARPVIGCNVAEANGDAPAGMSGNRTLTGSWRVLLAHPGNGPHVRNTALALLERGMLDRVATTFVDHPDSAVARWLRNAATLGGSRYLRELNRRAFPEIPFSRFRTYPVWELLRTLSSRISGRPVLTDALWEMGEKRFAAHVAGTLDPPVDAVYVYEHAALEILQAARRCGVLTFYEQPSQHHTSFSRILDDLRRDHPEAISADADRVHSADRHERRNRRRDQELRLANWVMCNSSFTRGTLVEAGVPNEKVLVTPLGFPPVDAPVRTAARRITVLSAGTQSALKGTHLLCEAWRRAALPEDRAELWLVGNRELPPHFFDGLPGRISVRDRIPHDELMALYRTVDLFVLPSYAEGFGMVITEAMSRGVPVLTTTNTAGPDLIEHGVNGWLVAPGDVAALTAQLRECIESPEQLREVGARAAETAARWQWTDYRHEIGRKIGEKLAEHGGRSRAGRAVGANLAGERLS